MPRYSVAYVNFFDNELKQRVVSAKTAVGACKKYLKSIAHEEDDGEWLKPIKTMDQLKQTMFDGDSLIDSIKISD